MTRGRRAALLSAALAVLPAASSLAAEPPAERSNAKNTPAMKEDYKDAFQFYTQGDYRQAIIKWTAILKDDPDQKTAATMILDARQKLLALTKSLRERTFAAVAAGDYRAAFLALQKLLDQDPNDPQLQALQLRLTNVIKVAPRLSPQGKAARAAVLGLKGYLALPPDLKLAHNGLRYARELAPEQELYKRLLAVVLAEFPALAAEDPVTPGMKLLEYKHYVALHQIYDAKYHLAVLTLDEILQLEPDDLAALKRRGSAYYSLGRMDEARAAWTAALKLQPDDATLKKFLAKTRASGAKRAPAAN